MQLDPINRRKAAASDPAPPGSVPPIESARETAFGCPRDFLNNRFVYLVLSPRARGLSAGVNLNPDGHCNFNCVYCEVDRRLPARELTLDVAAMAEELERMLHFVRSGQLRQLPAYSRLPAELLEMHHVTLSGDGEPTLAPEFEAALKAVLHVRARTPLHFFKIVLVTNATGLDRPEVQRGLDWLLPTDEVWAKLDGGSSEYTKRVCGVDVPLEQVLDSILRLARRRPVVIQSLFPSINGSEPKLAEIAEYARRLKDLKDGGARISLVQIYSATRPTHNPSCGHLSLKTLSAIAQFVRSTTGLTAEVF